MIADLINSEYEKYVISHNTVHQFITTHGCKQYKSVFRLPYTEQQMINRVLYVQRMMTIDLTNYYFSDEKTFLIAAQGAHYYCKPEPSSGHPNNWIVNHTPYHIR